MYIYVHFLNVSSHYALHYFDLSRCFLSDRRGGKALWGRDRIPKTSLPFSPPTVIPSPISYVQSPRTKNLPSPSPPTAAYPARISPTQNNNVLAPTHRSSSKMPPPTPNVKIVYIDPITSQSFHTSQEFYRVCARRGLEVRGTNCGIVLPPGGPS